MKDVIVDGKHMRPGYTTGSCVVAASAAAIRAIDEDRAQHRIAIDVPAGMRIEIPVKEVTRDRASATYSVIKDAGDDPDVTDGIEILCTIRRDNSGEVRIRKGTGVGTLTKPGLFGAVGELAINPVPKGEILRLLEDNRKDGISLQIDIPRGEEVAKKTFNPKLGITGGLSILGTTGIVRPMSKDAYIATVDMELRALSEEDARAVLLTPGNYGVQYAATHFPDLPAVQVSNYFGDALVLARDYGFRAIQILGHVGKLSKLSLGIWNTHSAVSDCRMEAFVYYLAKMGANARLFAAVEAETTADGAYAICRKAGNGDILQHMEAGIEVRVPRFLQDDAIAVSAKIYTMEA